MTRDNGAKTAIAPRPEMPKSLATDEQLRSFLTDRRGEFEGFARAAKCEPEELIAELVVLARRNPGILRCTPDSILDFMYDSARTGLIIGKGCFAVPVRDNKAGVTKLECWVGSHGMRQLATWAGGVRDVFAQVVYEGDPFEEVLGLYPDVKHSKGPNFGNMAKAIGVYGVLVISQAIRRHVYLSRARIERLRKLNKSDTTAASSPWVQHEQAMWEAKAVLAVCKTAPRNARFAHALALTERNEGLRLTDQGLEAAAPGASAEPLAPMASGAPTVTATATPAFEEEPAGAGAGAVVLPNWRVHPLANKRLSDCETDALAELLKELTENDKNGTYKLLLADIEAELEDRRVAAA